VPWGMADVLNRLGWVAYDLGLPAEASGYLERSLVLRRAWPQAGHHRDPESDGRGGEPAWQCGGCQSAA
jgi:hypothetical protein